MTATKKHADASPSSSSIWLNCPASVTKARGRARKPTIYTQEGSAAHIAAEMMLKNMKLPKSVLVDGDRIVLTEEMIDAAKEYVKYVKTLPGKLLIETRVKVTVQGEDLYGTADSIAIDDPILEIVDFKYGQGVAVEANSPQLRIYALGALEEAGPFVSIEDVIMTIVQPRSGGIKTVTLPVTELSNWEAGVLIPAVEKLANGDTTETPGDHCRWCVRAGECQALADLAMANARVAFDDIPPDPTSMSDEELGERLAYGEMILAWVNKMRAEVSGRIDNGQHVPGWKLVPKRAMRKWDDVDGAFVALKGAGVSFADVVRIETIGNVEKVLKKRRLDPEKVIYPYTKKDRQERPSSAKKMVAQRLTQVLKMYSMISIPRSILVTGLSTEV